eukprot:scaffold33889_cov101-Isochrysis_galbana.AAC.2
MAGSMAPVGAEGGQSARPAQAAAKSAAAAEVVPSRWRHASGGTAAWTVSGSTAAIGGAAIFLVISLPSALRDDRSVQGAR